MKLLIDIGNSRLKWAMYDGERLTLPCASAYHAGVMDEPAIWDELPIPDAVYCASVATDETTRWVEQRVKQQWNLSLKLLRTTVKCAGVSNGYRQPEKLGIDRWAALIGARELSRLPLCVVDCGSAVTVDVLDGNGVHLGGYIVPGIRLQQSLLQQGTAAIGNTYDGSRRNGWGHDTATCVNNGALEALAGLIERTRRQIDVSLGESAQVFVTGGDAPAVLPLLDFSPIYEENLVLLGMARMVKELEV